MIEKKISLVVTFNDLTMVQDQIMNIYIGPG